MNKKQLIPPDNQNTFLILDDHHIVPFYGFSPEKIKQSARAIIKNPSKPIQRTTILNFIVKELGFTGGYADYKKSYRKLESFLQENGLLEYRDLTSHYCRYGRLKGLSFLIGNSKEYRQYLSDRLFLSGKPLPERVLFKDFDFTDYQLYQKTQNIKGDYLNFVKSEYRPLVEDIHIELSKDREINDIDCDANYFFIDANSCINFLDDSLVCPELGEGYISRLYFPGKKHENEQKSVKRFSILKSHLINIPELWAEIVPFNNNVIFLKEGNFYDYVIKNQRTRIFDRKYPKHCSAEDTTYIQSEQRFFNEAYYFEKHEWRELNSHEAEKYHYENGGKAGYSYPGEDVILKRYLESKERYPFSPKKRKYRKRVIQLPGFYKERLRNGKELYVSNLVSIEDFFRFFESTDYYKRRCKEFYDDIYTMNMESDITLPVAVTWYDANAFAAWFSRENGVNARLLNLNEAEEIFPDNNTLSEMLSDNKSSNYQASIVVISLIEADGELSISFKDKRRYNKGESVEEKKSSDKKLIRLEKSITKVKQYYKTDYKKHHSENTYPSMFDDTFFLFNSQLTWGEKKSGLKFLLHGDFTELLGQDNADSGGAPAFIYHGQSDFEQFDYYPFQPYRYCATQSCKNNKRKLGFRMCYEA